MRPWRSLYHRLILSRSIVLESLYEVCYIVNQMCFKVHAIHGAETRHEYVVIKKF